MTRKSLAWPRRVEHAIATSEASNDIRDQAREELPPEEKLMLFDGGPACPAGANEECLAAS